MQGNKRYASPEEEAFFRRHRRRHWIVLIILGSVAIFYRPLIEITTKAVPVSWEETLGRTMFKDDAVSISDPEIEKTIDLVSQRLLIAAGQQPYTFQFTIGRSRIRNAYAVPGGHIVIYSGLVQDLGNENELAAVMAHEMEHVLHRHSLQNLIFSNGFSLMISMLTGRMSDTYSWLRILSDLKFSRDQEAEADLKGIQLLSAAKLPPGSMVNFFRRLKERSQPGNAAAQILSTHPTTDERIAVLQRVLQRLPRTTLLPLNVDWETFKARCAKETAKAPEKRP